MSRCSMLPSLFGAGLQVLALSVDDASDRHRPPGAATGCALYLRRNRSLPGRIRDDILRDLPDPELLADAGLAGSSEAPDM